MMETITRKLPVLNSLVTIKDHSLEDYPEITGLGGVWWTRSAVAVSCLPDSDGETRITLGLSAAIGLDSAPIFDRCLTTPSRYISVELVPRRKIMNVPVPTDLTRVRVWSNGHLDTEWLVIGVG